MNAIPPLPEVDNNTHFDQWENGLASTIFKNRIVTLANSQPCEACQGRATTVARALNSFVTNDTVKTKQLINREMARQFHEAKQPQPNNQVYVYKEITDSVLNPEEAKEAIEALQQAVETFLSETSNCEEGHQARQLNMSFLLKLYVEGLMTHLEDSNSLNDVKLAANYNKLMRQVEKQTAQVMKQVNNMAGSTGSCLKWAMVAPIAMCAAFILMVGALSLWGLIMDPYIPKAILT